MARAQRVSFMRYSQKSLACQEDAHTSRGVGAAVKE